MTNFARLDSADHFLAAVVGAVRRHYARPTPPGAEGREARMLTRAVKHRDRAASDLVRSGVPEGVVASRLRDRAADRDRAHQAAARTARPARASR